MGKQEFDRGAAIKTLAQLIRASSDEQLSDMAIKARARLQNPMPAILKKVPGRNTADKAARCGVSRQCWYSWLKGVYRPTGEQAQRIAKLTGIPVALIRGKGEKPRRKPTPKPTTGETVSA